MTAKHKNILPKWFDSELIAYALFAVISVGTVFYLFYYDPVNYTRLITEDKFAEYGTFVSFAVAGILLLTLSLKRGPAVRRIIWGVIGIVTLLLAAEEISWGQRIIDVRTPDILSLHNKQGEITLHNLVAFDSVNRRLHIIASYLILAYLVLSIAVLALMPRLEEKLASIGLRLIQIKLIPVFLLAPYFFISYPAAKADEIGEFFLGIAVLMWAVDLFLASAKRINISSFRSVLVMAGMLLVVSVLSAMLTYRHSSELTMRLNHMASVDYPSFRMYEQALSLYTYIYEHPRYLTKETRVNHARLLQMSGKQSEAAQILSQEAIDLEARKSAEPLNSYQLRQLGVIYTLLLENELADDYFDQAIEFDNKKLAAASSPDEKAELLWSISKTMIEQGKIAAAITSIEQAIEYAHSPVFRFNLEKEKKRLGKKLDGYS